MTNPSPPKKRKFAVIQAKGQKPVVIPYTTDKKRKEKKIHRHKWETSWCDCPFHEVTHYDCKCGATKIGDKIHPTTP